MGKDLERDQYKTGKDRSAFTSADDEVYRLASDLDGVRE